MDCFFALIHTHLTEGSQSIWRRLEDRHSSAACQREDVRMAGCMNEWMEGAHDVRGPTGPHRRSRASPSNSLHLGAVRGRECVPASAWP